MSDTFRCVVGVPSGNTWDAQFAMCLVNLVAYFDKCPVPGYTRQELRVVNVRSSILPRNRMNLVKAARAAKATHLLFLDSDHTFPKDLVHRLGMARKLVVAANCVTKQIPARPTARAFSEEVAEGEPVYSESQKLELVWRVGTGVMLVNMKVFAAIGDGCWDMKYLPERDDYQGEDWSFCEALQKVGIPIWVDHGVSQQIGHVGSFEYTHAVIGELVQAAE